MLLSAHDASPVLPGRGETCGESPVPYCCTPFPLAPPEIDETTGDRVSGLGVAPILYIRAGYDFTKKFILYFESDVFVVRSAGGADSVLKFKYRINPKWDVAAGYRASAYELDFPELKNSFDVGGWAVHVAHSF